MQSLLDAGAWIEAPDDDGFTPLLVAAVRGRPEAAVILLHAGADVNARTHCGWTSLDCIETSLENWEMHGHSESGLLSATNEDFVATASILRESGGIARRSRK